MKRRVVVTGLGAITPIGNSVPEFWEGVKAGKVGIGEITKFDTSDYKVKIAAEVKDFEPKNYMDFKAAKRMETFSQYAVAAALEACKDAAIDMEQEDPFRVGVIVGSGIGSLQTVEREYTKIVEKGPNRVHPLMVPLMISNMAAGNDHSAWCKRKMYKRCDSMCIRNPLYRRCIPCHSVRGCGSDVCRRYGKRHLSDRCGRIYCSDRTDHIQ